MIKELGHQEDITLLNVYASKNRGLKCVKQKLRNWKKKKKDKSIINVGDFNTSLPKFEKNRQKIHNNIEDLKNIIKQFDLIDIILRNYRKVILFKYICKSQKIKHMLEHKTSLNKHIRTEIMESIFLVYSGNKLQIDKITNR